MHLSRSLWPLCLFGVVAFAACGDDDSQSGTADGGATGTGGAGGAGTTNGGAGASDSAGAPSNSSGAAGSDATAGAAGQAGTSGGSSGNAGSGAVGGSNVAGEGGSAGDAAAGAAGQGGPSADRCTQGGREYDCETCQTVNDEKGGCCYDVSNQCGDECWSLVSSCDCVGTDKSSAGCVQACATSAGAGSAAAAQYLALLVCTLGQQSALAPGACGHACLDLKLPECKDGGKAHLDCDSCYEAEQRPGACCAAESSACSANDECTALTDCEGACGDAACITSCKAEHSGGVYDAEALRECLGGTDAHYGACGEVCKPVQCKQGGTAYASCEACQNALADSCCRVELAACVKIGGCSPPGPEWDAAALCFNGDGVSGGAACTSVCSP